MSLPPALNKRCTVRVLDGHELIVVQNGFSVKDFLRTALDGVYCPEGSSEPSLKKIITKKTWLIARETPEDALDTARTIVKYCKEGGDSGTFPITAKVCVGVCNNSSSSVCNIFNAASSTTSYLQISFFSIFS